MKRFSIIFAALFLVLAINAQSPDKFNYQAIIRNGDGSIKTNQRVNIQIGIIQGSVTGTSKYVETHTVTSSNLGLVNLVIGDGKVVTGSLSSVDWSTGPTFLKIWVDGAEMGTSQLMSVPYAKYAEKAGNEFSGNYSDLSGKPALFNGDYNSLLHRPGFRDSINKYSVTLTGNQTIKGDKLFTGTLTSTLNANNKTITNVSSPINDNDAVNKAYVDFLKRELRELQNRLFPEIPPDSDGLVAFYPFNGNANDESGNGNDGNPSQGCLWGKDRFGTSSKALFLDGNNLVSIPSSQSLDITRSLTLAIWFKSDRLDQFNMLIYRGDIVTYADPYWIRTENNKIRFERDYMQLNSPTQEFSLTGLDSSIYHFYVSTYNDSTGVISLYIDGALVLQEVHPGEFNYSTSHMINNIGGIDNIPYCYGYIDEVRIYNIALPPGKINSLFHEGGWAK